MTDLERRLAELEALTQNPWCDIETLVEHADLLTEQMKITQPAYFRKPEPPREEPRPKRDRDSLYMNTMIRTAGDGK